MRVCMLILFLLVMPGLLVAQDKMGTTFSGQAAQDPGPCATAANFMSEQDVNRLITDMLDRINIRNRFIIVSCTTVPNCQAVLYKGKPYILYNPNFLEEVKRLNFSNAEIKISDRNWEALSILAHELGHHVNNHLLNPLPDATQRDMELEADEFVGSMIFWMGGSRDQALAAFLALPESGSYTHPGRQQRLAAVGRGWDKVKSRMKDPKQDPVRPDPQPEPVRPTPVSPGRVSVASVAIGKQVWMMENLNVVHFRNGDPIPEARTDEEWIRANESKEPVWCYYENNSSRGLLYGKLYNWYAVHDSRGLAPIGWHIPSNEEWSALIKGLGGAAVAGGKLKSNSGWYSNGNGSNESQFAAIPGGYREADGTFSSVGYSGFWWSISVSRNDYWGRYLNSSGIAAYPYSGNNWIGGGFSVRCVKD